MLITKSNYSKFINAKEVIIGENVYIEEGTYISAIGGSAEKVIIGDNVYIGKDNLILVPEFQIGDYGTIHKNSRISGYKKCVIGHNFWMDQNCILNSTDEMVIGNNVGIGAYSQLWTHIKFGDVLEGCRFNSTKKMNIGNDVWFVGHCIVSPITAHDKSMAMVGSVITKDMEENHIYGGAPAKDLTDKLGPQFVERSIEEKYSIMKSKLEEFCEKNKIKNPPIKIVVDSNSINLEDEISYFIISERSYTKKLTKVEIDFMKFLLPLAKFTPYN